MKNMPLMPTKLLPLNLEFHIQKQIDTHFNHEQITS